jgi:hypothetical protein
MIPTGEKHFRAGWRRAAAAAVLSLGGVLSVSSADIDGDIADGEYTNRLSFDAGSYVLYWSLEQDTAFFGIQARTGGWVALGVDPREVMAEADMVFGSVDADGRVEALDCYSTGLFGPHPPDDELGGEQNILSFAGKQEGGFTTFEFSRPLTSGDPYDKPLSADKQIDIIWAYGNSDDVQQQHIRRGSGTLSSDAGAVQARAADPQPRGRLHSLLVPVHALLMASSFVLLFAGMLFPRYFKRRRWWLKAHRRIGIAGSALGVAGVVVAGYMISRTTGVHLRVLHSVSGLATIVLMLISPFLGHFMLKIRKHPKRAKKVRAVHRWLGRATLLAMAVTIVLGLSQAGIL